MRNVISLVGKFLVGLGLAGLVIVVTPVMQAQVVSSNGGSIQGTITDPSGAAVPGAKIAITAAETGFARTLTTDSSGYYSVGPLTPGPYKVTITMSGFQVLSVNTQIQVGTATPGSFKLTVGTTGETVEVNAGAIQVNTDQGGVSDVLTSQQIDSLPINGRNFLDVAQIEPGVILQSGGSFDPTKAGYSALSIAGVSGRTTRILLDGQDITDETVGTTIFNVSQGAIGEFQLNRSTQDVTGDVTSTGQVLVTTKTGTNRFHGEAFYNFQDSRALFATEFNAQAPFQRNQFGGSVGGPIFKDKLFFFANVERIKQDASQPIGVGSVFPQYQGLAVPSPYRETYSTARLDYHGPLGGVYFFRANYNVNLSTGTFGTGFQLYGNKDNTPGFAGGADYQFGHFTHSFRGSYEKFHNLIGDLSAQAPINLLPGIAFENVVQNLQTGPNIDAPQGTFQTDKQVRYDGSWTKGPHTFRFGYSINRILGGGFAAFVGLGPRLRETAGTLFPGGVDPTTQAPLPGCGAVLGAASCPSDPLNGYHASSVLLGNGLGFFTENPGFGLIGGGVHDWREGAYLADSWKATSNLTLTAGVRWSVDTDRANQDLASIPCSAIDTANVFGDPTQLPCTGSSSLFGAWGSGLAGAVHQPYANFAPQAGLNYALPDHKTVFRAGFGIFFEGDVFNNTTNARTGVLPSGPFFNDVSPCGAGKFNQPDGTTVSSATVGGVTHTISDICTTLPIKQAAPYVLALQGVYQANSKAHSSSVNGGFIGETLDAAGVYGAPYRTPYSEQWNFGVQRELTRGSVLSIDYVHNSTIKIAQEVDTNHLGAARYFNTTAAKAAIAATTASAGCTGGTSAAAINCAIAAGATIDDFAGNGLDSAAQYLGGSPASAFGGTYNANCANIPDGNFGSGVACGAAFPGANPLLGSGSFQLPIGRSGYDALQVVYREQKAHPLPGIDRSNMQVSYNLSRIVSSSGGGSDQFFGGAGSFDNDNPMAYIGRAGLDRTNQLSFGGSFLIKHGPQMGIIGHFYSALPTTLTLDASASPVGNIFRSDLTGDGTVGDLAPGTLPGDYMHGVKPGNLASFITNFNGTQAGKLTPAGQVLVTNGLFTAAQLTSLGAVVQTLPTLKQSTALANPAFRQVDLNFSYPIRIGHYAHMFGEAATLEPGIAFYNVGNFSNFGGGGGNPAVAPYSGDLGTSVAGNVNGPNTFATQNTSRVIRQTGTYDQGAPRTTEFQLKFTF